MLAVALALCAALSWGIADFVAGLKSRKLPILTVMALSQAVGLLFIATIVAARGTGLPDADSLAVAAASALAGLSGLAAFYGGLAVGAMAIVAPISATAAAIPVLFGIATGQRLTAAQAVGVAVALVGVVLASRERDAQQVRPGRPAAGAGLAVVAAFGFGCFFVAMERASEEDALWAIAANRTAGVGLLAVLVLVARPSLAVARADARGLAAVGLLDMGANALYALATTHGVIGVVAVLASLYPVVVVALAHFVLRERVAPWQRAGVAAALAGVALIVAG